MAAVFDMSEVIEAAGDLIAADGPVRDEGRRVLLRGGMEIRRGAWSILSTSGAYTKHYRRAITVEAMNDGLVVEVGPEIGRTQAFLGKILEDGTSTSPAFPHLEPALADEAPVVARFVEDVAVRSLFGGR